MGRELKKVFVKKKEGKSSFAIILICFLGVFLLMMTQMDSTTNINRLQKVEQIGREYLLRMESDGYLTSTDRIELNSELTSLGYVSNVNITAPISEVGYGERIALKIEYDLEVEAISGADLFNYRNDSKTIRKTFRESTTSKH